MDPYASVAALGRALRAKELTARELAEACLARIARLDPALNAFRVVLADEARDAADAAQERLDAGDPDPMLGIPVAIKDTTAMAGHVTAMGTAAFGAPATEDAEFVRRLRAAGAVLIGKTHLPEFALFPFTASESWGVTRNPWDVTRSSGGSSGGAATAVAAGLVPVAHATDGGGSIRIPAAYSGLYGLKVTRGLVSLAPHAEHWFGLSVANCVARTVEDAALFLGTVADDPRPDYAAAARRETGGQRLRVAWTLTPPVPTPIAPEIKEAVRATAALLASLGHTVTEAKVDWGVQLPSFLPRYLAGLREDVAAMPHPERLERRTRQLAALGRPFTPARVEAARARGERIAERMSRSFEDYDVVLTPTVTQLPPPAGAFMGKSLARTMYHSAGVAAFTSPWNVAGLPAAAVPAGFTEGGLPLSIQLAGPAHGEETLLALSAELESARPWAHKEPAGLI